MSHTAQRRRPLAYRPSPPQGRGSPASLFPPFLDRLGLTKAGATADLAARGRLPLAVLVGALCVGLAVSALRVAPASAADINALFHQWLDNDLWPEAHKAGVSEATFNAAFSGVTPNLKLPGLVMPGEKPKPPEIQHQAEFREPSAYFAPNILDAVVAGGRARAKTYASALGQIEKTYGVPPGIVLAVWGRESGFGTASLPYDAIQVLGTKAFMSLRKETFRPEIVAALVMIERGDVTPRGMKSSWAGALGQPQFEPTSYLKYAVDFDGDGRADIWNSDVDSLASIAHYLAAHGWVRGRDWGFEVTLPESMSCALEGPDRGKKISDWEAMGITRVGGKAFPAHEEREVGFLMMPAGRYGPAFLATPNFYVLKDYNTSDLYALFVGHAADRIMYGDIQFTAPWRQLDNVSRGDIAAMQAALEKAGYDVGGADGLPGFKTRRAIGDWQAKHGMAPTCFPDAGLAKALR